jgi:hypothetical protein
VQTNPNSLAGRQDGRLAGFRFHSYGLFCWWFGVGWTNFATTSGPSALRFAAEVLFLFSDVAPLRQFLWLTLATYGGCLLLGSSRNGRGYQCSRLLVGLADRFYLLRSKKAGCWFAIQRYEQWSVVWCSDSLGDKLSLGNILLQGASYTRGENSIKIFSVVARAWV